MAKKRVLILGAGLCGLSAAYYLQEKGFESIVFEKDSEAGGLCRSKQVKDFIFDYDGHLLHFKRKDSFELVKRLLRDNFSDYERSAWVYSYGRFIRYPFQANLHALPADITKDCLLGFVQASKNGYHKENKKNPSFLDWINFSLGEGIARHFMIPYNTKFWGIPPQALTSEWLDGFIPVPSLTQVIAGTVEDISISLGYNAKFFYPQKGGINQLPEALVKKVKNINFNCAVTRIDLKQKEIQLNSGSKEKFDYAVSTLPLPEMPDLVNNLPVKIIGLCKKLKWVSIFNLNLGVEKKDDSGRHWVYFPEDKFCFFRAGFAHNFSSCAPAGKSSLYTEVSYTQERPIDKTKIMLQIKSDLIKSEILNPGDKILVEDINDIKYGYPVYDWNYSLARKGILDYLEKNSVLGCGRYGSWRYFSMEDAILDGKRAAESISL